MIQTKLSNDRFRGSSIQLADASMDFIHHGMLRIGLRPAEGTIVPFEVIVGHNSRKKCARGSVKTSSDSEGRTHFCGMLRVLVTSF